MPIFDYICKCGHVWNDHKVTRSRDDVHCPKCNEVMTRKFPTEINFKMNRMIPNRMPIPKEIVENPNGWLNEPI